MIKLRPVNLLNPNIEIEILMYCPYRSGGGGGGCVEISIRLIFPDDHVLNSQDHFVF